jgi:signal peptidase II
VFLGGRYINLWTPVIIIVLLDQLLKLYIKTNFEIGESFSIFPWFVIYFVENNGFAFGLEFFGKYGKFFLTLTRIIFVVFICFWLKKLLIKGGASRLLIFAFILIISGAIGNIIDSVFYGVVFGYAPLFCGRVVDMFYFPLLTGTYPEWVPFLGGGEFVFFRYIFNIADSAITLGAFLVLFLHKQIPTK